MIRKDELGRKKIDARRYVLVANAPESLEYVETYYKTIEYRQNKAYVKRSS